PEGIDAFPTKDALVALIKENEPRLIWKTLVYRQVIRKDAPQAFLRLKTWGDRVRWVTENPERVDEGIFQQDQALQAKRRFHLVLFDALDRTADDWKTMNRLVRGLLQVVLDMRAYKRIRLKVFLRPDQISDPEVRGFPDASKLLDGKESLNWSQRDLYGLLWRYLANGTESGDVFRRGCQKIVPKAKWANDFFGDYEVPPLLNQDEETQTEIFHAITGPWMGRDQRRGFPYSWLHGHLCDVHNMVSPRSFLAAIRHAALDRRDDHDFPIHFESIKLGVQAASRIRVEELEEDFPWMKELFKPLRGMNVPCPLEAFEEKWIASKTLESLKATAVRHPQRIELGSVGILNDLLDLGFVEQLKDKRINLPDVYRVGYGLGRKGGVKPLKTRE
ncbi:MAG TPA: hypothetical protein PKY05_02865, partial [Fibrobacteria bacterium]|nr:hypothetical protein [Fibrobacteria bacterium]